MKKRLSTSSSFEISLALAVRFPVPLGLAYRRDIRCTLTHHPCAAGKRCPLQRKQSGATVLVRSCRLQRRKRRKKPATVALVRWGVPCTRWYPCPCWYRGTGTAQPGCDPHGVRLHRSSVTGCIFKYIFNSVVTMSLLTDSSRPGTTTLCSSTIRLHSRRTHLLRGQTGSSISAEI